MDRLHRSLTEETRSSRRLLFVYLTIGDPSPAGTQELALSALEGGADGIELGLPTPVPDRSGGEIRDSLLRGLATVPSLKLGLTVCSRLRAVAPTTPIVLMAYVHLARDLGWVRFAKECLAAGTDALVIPDLRDPEVLSVIRETELGVIPLIRSQQGIDPHFAELEAHATHLTYHTLAFRTGEAVDLALQIDRIRTIRAVARKPILWGFGLRRSEEIRALAPYGDAFVVGSELYRRLKNVPRRQQFAAVGRWVREWKEACSVDFET